VTPGPHRFKNDYIDQAHAADTEGALFRPVSNNRTVRLDSAITPVRVYKLVRRYALGLGLKISARETVRQGTAHVMDKARGDLTL
jgi:hypothetical protein